MKNINRLSLPSTQGAAVTFVVALALSGCSTVKTQSATDLPPVIDAKQVARAQTYFDGLQASISKSSDATCAASVSSSRSASVESSGPSEANEWRAELKVANACVQSQNWPSLEGLGNQMAQRWPDSPWGAFYLSLAAEGRHEFRRALWMIELADRKSGRLQGLFAYQRSRVLFDLGEMQASIAEMNRAMTLNPSLIDGDLFLAELAAKDLDWDQAVSRYQAALRIDSMNSEAIKGLKEVEAQRKPAGGKQ
jgi:tetratricopeptide (TPR) repeat protein